MLIRPIIYTPDIYRVVISSFHHIVQIPLQISSRSPTTPETSVLVLIGQLATSLAMGRLRVRSIGGPFQRMTAAPLISCANASLSRAGLDWLLRPLQVLGLHLLPARALASNRRCFTSASSRSIRNSAIYGGLASSSCSSTTTSLRLHACINACVYEHGRHACMQAVQCSSN